LTDETENQQMRDHVPVPQYTGIINLKVAYFNRAPALDAPVGWPHGNFAKTFGVRKLHVKSLGYRVAVSASS